MKLIYLLFILLISLLNARENPFEPTEDYRYEINKSVDFSIYRGEIDSSYEFVDKKESDYEDMTAPKISTPKMSENSISEELMNTNGESEQSMNMNSESNELRKNENKQSLENSIKEIKASLEVKDKKWKKSEKKAKELSSQLKKMKNDPIIYVRLRDDVNKVSNKKAMNNSMNMKMNNKMSSQKMMLNSNPLPFLSVQQEDACLEIHTKYKVFKKFYIKEENKLVLDFRGKTMFYTRRDALNTTGFDKFILGNHPKKSFFRAVIVLQKPLSHYKVSYEKGMVLVHFDEKMVN